MTDTMQGVGAGTETTSLPGGATVPGATACRHCGAPLELTVVDLGKSPLCQTVLTDDELERGESFYPLHVRVCERCWLAQIPELAAPEEIFGEYAYFSAYSDSWVEHARRYVEEMCARLALGPESLVVELASNDGYLLQHFLPKGVPVLGVEPAQNVAEAAVARGVETITEFFGAELGARLARERGHADLVLGNNVLAQVPDINDFAAGVAALLAPDGTATFEFPHLAKLVEHFEYDTIYHEHFSYFSLHSIHSIFGAQGLELPPVRQLLQEDHVRVELLQRGSDRAHVVVLELVALPRPVHLADVPGHDPEGARGGP